MKESLTVKFVSYSILFIGAAVICFPIVFSFLLSISSNTDISNAVFLPSAIRFDNYVRAFETQPLLSYMMNSMIVAVTCTVAQIVLALLASYAIVFFEFRGKNILFGLFMATMMIPAEVLVISNFHTIRSLGMIDTFPGLILPGMASTFGIFLLRQNLKQIPWELREAGQVAGISDFRFFCRVVVPIARNSIVTLAIYNFLVSWNSYMWPLLSTTDETVRTVQIGLRQLKTVEGGSDYGMMSAGAVIVSIPTLILIFAGQRRLQDGLTKGAIK